MELGKAFGQYFETNEILESIGFIELSDFNIMSADTYSEKDILEAVKNTGLKKELLCATLQTAIVGFGNKTFGTVTIDKKVVEVKEIYEKANVRYKLSQNAKLEPSDLTPRRLQRLFRGHIKNYIIEKQTPSYLWRKYSTRNPDYFSLVFPGSEHLVSNEEEAAYLFETYKKLDSIHNTNITERILRVFAARGIRLNMSIEN
jgi:hypothetical protein